MKKHNLFKISLSAAIVAAAILFTGCPGEAEKPVDNTPVENPDAKDPATEDPTTEDPSTENKTDNPSEENPSTENPIENPTEEVPVEPTPVPQVTFIPVPTLSFNMTDAEALAAVIPSSQDRSARTARYARAARNAEAEDLEESEETEDSEPLLEKIFEDGTVEDAMEIKGGEADTNWSNIDYVILPPASVNSSDVYLLMKEYTRTSVTIVNETTNDKSTEDETTSDETVENETTSDETVENETTENGSSEETTVKTIDEDKVTIKDWYLSPLICVHKDNTYDDVFLESPYDVEQTFRIESRENIQFFKDGSLVYLCSGAGYQHFLNKWDPVTKQTTQLYAMDFPAEEGSLFIRSFSIDNSEDYIYMYLDRTDANGYGYQYIKIIKLSDPSFNKEIGNWFPGVRGWCYNPYDDSLYYSQHSDGEADQGCYKADKTGSNPEHITLDMFDHLIPESSQKVWGTYGCGENIDKLINILSMQFDEENIGVFTYNEEFTYTTNLDHYYFWGNYIFANGNLYLKHSYYCDSTNGHKDIIMAIPLSGSDSDIKNLLEFNPNISLHSWAVNENSLFISGSIYETNEPVNFKIDLKTETQTTIQSDSAFGSIAAF